MHWSCPCHIAWRHFCASAKKILDFLHSTNAIVIVFIGLELNALRVCNLRRRPGSPHTTLHGLACFASNLKFEPRQQIHCPINALQIKVLYVCCTGAIEVSTPRKDTVTIPLCRGGILYTFRPTLQISKCRVSGLQEASRPRRGRPEQQQKPAKEPAAKNAST